MAWPKVISDVIMTGFLSWCNLPRTVFPVALFVQALATLESGVPKPDNLVHLMSAFQAGIFFWCKDILSSDGVKAETKKCVTELLNRCEHWKRERERRES